MKVGDLVKSVYRDDYAIITKVWLADAVGEYAAEFIYSDGKRGVQPNSNIRSILRFGLKNDK